MEFVFSSLGPSLTTFCSASCTNLRGVEPFRDENGRISFIEPSTSSAMSSRFSRTIYVGNLPLDVRESEMDDLFYKYERSREAEDAIRGRDGYNFDGHYLRVELAHGGRGPPSVVDRRGGYGSGGGGRYGASRHSEFRGAV
ncbi:hypothetical protein Taro_047091 [Colocasia esculenta]|uniref:RRM domain-containing protein n=1 Tax=Colocasia esculenta TaxID=4460 RepID=A0A843X060_COLES|nr:hypothetical protein [Colocasia esculenta]